MFLIVLQHALFYSGVYDLSYSMGGVNYYSIIFTFLHSICVIATNTYVLISGYFLVNENFRLSKLIKIVLEVLFYSWLFFTIVVFNRGLSGLDVKLILPSILPVTYIGYWFVSAYVAMYILMPIMNLLIRSITQKQFLGVLLILFCLFSLITSILPLSQIMGIHRFGQSVVWFVVLYMIGAYMRLYVRRSSWKNISKKVLFCSILFMNLWWVVSTTIAYNFHMDIVHNERVQIILKWFFSYDTIPVLFSSIALFQLFRNISISNSFVLSLIKNLSPLVFAVYLIHCNVHVQSFIWSYLKSFTELFPLLPLVVICYSFVVFLLCMSIDVFRKFLMDCVYRCKRYQDIMNKVEIFVNNVYNRICNYLIEIT